MNKKRTDPLQFCLLLVFMMAYCAPPTKAEPLSVPLRCSSKHGDQWIRHGELTGRPLPIPKCANADGTKRRNNTPGGVGEGDRSRRNDAPNGGVGSRRDHQRDRLR